MPMMYALTPSYVPHWRVWIQEDDLTDESEYAESRRKAHSILKHASIWGGADKTDEFGGVQCKGYEMRDLGTALQIIADLEAPK